MKQSSGHAKKWDEASRDELLAEVRYLNYHIAELQEDLLDSKERERDLLQKIKVRTHSTTILLTIWLLFESHF